MATRRDLDLSLTLSRPEQDERLERGGKRLVQLRLALGGKLASPMARSAWGRRCAWSSRAGTPAARAARSNG